ncbi:MAG: FtsX-like permease family protein [Bacteroidales bacterium]|nr:FtsX-like permease family protein [Bacteroidales bacterium]
MKLAIKLAYRNLIGAGLRTWLNVIVLSFAFVMIIAMKGILVGWDRQAKNDMIHWEVGGGQYWNENYDPYDIFTLTEAHSAIPGQFESEIAKGDMEPLLIMPGTVLKEGRANPILIKGIDPEQDIFDLPTKSMKKSAPEGLPAIIGNIMAKDFKLEKGDVITLNWSGKGGVTDSVRLYIADVFFTNVPSVTKSQVWIPLVSLQALMDMPNEATLLTFRDPDKERPKVAGWSLQTHELLFKDMEEMIQTKTIGQSFFYVILLLLALLAIFDTQVLSIFRRQKEIGTYVALGYTRREVVGLFTIEGAMHAVLAAIVAAIYGIPFLLWFAKTGISLGIDAADYGFAIAATMYPVYSGSLILGTTLAVLLATSIVSYLPARKIAKMNPTEALRGKIQ